MVLAMGLVRRYNSIRSCPFIGISAYQLLYSCSVSQAYQHGALVNRFKCFSSSSIMLVTGSGGFSSRVRGSREPGSTQLYSGHKHIGTTVIRFMGILARGLVGLYSISAYQLLCSSSDIIGVLAQDLSTGHGSTGILARSLVNHGGSTVPATFDLQLSCLCGSRVPAVVLSSVGVLAQLLSLNLACSQCVHVVVGYQPSYRRRIGAALVVEFGLQPLCRI